MMVKNDKLKVFCDNSGMKDDIIQIFFSERAINVKWFG